MNRYPLMMQHPAHRRGEVREERGIDPVTGRGYVDRVGTADFMPNVEVNTDEQEAEYRAKGYLAMGETMQKHTTYAEYPKMMTHPDHVDAIPQAFDAKIVDGQLVKFAVPGAPEKLPPKTVNSAAQEEEFAARGYVPGGIRNEEAFVSAHAAPQRPGHAFHEYPKWVNGVLCQDAGEEATASGRAPPTLPQAPTLAPPPTDPGVVELRAQVAALAAGQVAILEALSARPDRRTKAHRKPRIERADAPM